MWPSKALRRVFPVRAHQTRIARPNGSEDRGEAADSESLGQSVLEEINPEIVLGTVLYGD